ncbi:thiamine diphosphokinase [Clostridium amazonitimonense]|uniref:thiamine diphosphokinase n=1 Tax=Clostridium amazonitimonense TaxID=1499689 RepID=UPI000509D68E|nr:thiamine diphosphokinase [Clostridium amazonitimonense]
MKTVIVSGGKAPSFDLISKETKDCDFIIGADKGAEVLYKYGIKPNILLGDFDSIDKDVLMYFKNNLEFIDVYPVEKDFTDTELALLKAIEKQSEKIVFLGCTGSRLDHVLANIGLLRRCLKEGIEAYIKDDNNCIFLTDKSCKLEGEKGEIISFQAFGEVVKGFNIYNAKYELRNYNLSLGDPVTVSNEFLHNDISISFERGIVIVIYSKD